MSKKSKRRNKPYTGADAKQQTPTVHRYTAVVRSPLSEWWHGHKRAVKVIATISAVAIVAIWLLLELIHLLFWGSAF